MRKPNVTTLIESLEREAKLLSKCCRLLHFRWPQHCRQICFHLLVVRGLLAQVSTDSTQRQVAPRRRRKGSIGSAELGIGGAGESETS